MASAEHGYDPASSSTMQASLHWIHQHSVDEIMSVVPSDPFGDGSTVYRQALVHSLDLFSEAGRMPAGAPEENFHLDGSALSPRGCRTNSATLSDREPG